MFYFNLCYFCASLAQTHSQARSSILTTTRATTSMRPSTSHRTECADDYPQSITLIIFPYTRFFCFPSGHTHIYSSIHLFLTTLLSLFLISIVCRYVHIVCTDERNSKVIILTTTWSRNRNVSERSHPKSHRAFTRIHNTLEQEREENKG